MKRPLQTSCSCWLAILILGQFAGCESKKTPSRGSSSAALTTDEKVEFKKAIIVKITVDADSHLWPTVTMPKYKGRLPGKRQSKARFVFVVRDKSMKVVNRRPVYDKEFADGRTLDFHVSQGSYSVALEAVAPIDGHTVQLSNRVSFDFEKVEPALLAEADLSRLRLPAGLSNFWRDYNTELVPIEKADEVLKKANDYEAMDVHKAYYYEAIPTAKVKVAVAYCKDGKSEKALEILEEVKAKGYLPVDLLRLSVLDPIRETEQFKSIQQVAKTESEADSIGPWVVVEQPFCQVEDLLKVETVPPLPSAASFNGKPVMIWTGMGVNRGLLESLAEKHQPIVAIVGNKPKKAIKGVDVYVSKLPPRAMAVDGTSMIWVADADGNVVYNQRQDVYTSELEPVHVIDYLKSKQKAN